MKKGIVFQRSELTLLLSLIENKIQFYERSKWNTENDEIRIARIHDLNVVYGKIGSMITLGDSVSLGDPKPVKE